MARVAARAARQRPLDGRIQAGRPRPLAVHDRGVGRPPRDAARRARSQARRRPDRARRRVLRGRGALRHVRESRSRARRVARRRGEAGCQGPARQDLARQAARGRRRAPARALRRLVRALPAQLGRLQGRQEGAAAAGRARLRRRLPASDPPDRRDEPQGPQQHAPGGEGRSGQSLGDRRQGRRARRGPSRARDAEGVRRPRRRGAEGGARDRARLRDPDLARPPLADRASGVVQPAARRDAQVRREPAQALPGHLQRQLRLRGLARACGRR